MNQGRMLSSSIFYSPEQMPKLQQYDCLTASGQAVSVMAANQEHAFLACCELLSDTPGSLFHIRLSNEW
jgi:hypothetical protein